MKSAEINTSAEMQALVTEARGQEMNAEQEAAAQRQKTAEQNATETKERMNEAMG